MFDELMEVQEMRLKQKGVIVWSPGMNKQYWENQAEQEGYYLVSNPGYTELWGF